jgi:hexosaminidase
MNPNPRILSRIVPLVAAVLAVFTAPAGATPPLMPWPAQVEWRAGGLPIAADFRVRIDGHDDARLRAGIGRALDRLERRAGVSFGDRFVRAGGALVIACDAAGSAIPRLGDDESYTLAVRPEGAILRAANVVGALRGLETFLQLVEKDGAGFAAAGAVIRDAPRFPWRGLMIDLARHFQPPEVLHRNLDAMAAVKLNVLHLHLTDDQGFRVESRRHPELHAVSAADGYLTQEQVRTLIAAAAERGIRVVPEFDVPGHTAAWLASHPEIATTPGPHAVARRWGVLDDVMDPTRPETHALLESFFGEMAVLFPDPFFHIGGDENNGKQWDASARIQDFKRQHGLADNAALHAWFNQKLAAMLTRHGKRLVGWDEVLHPDLPTDAVVQSWRGPESLARAVQQGFSGLLSAGYYLDLHLSAEEHYAADPLPVDSPLTPEQAARVLGGEAPMWTEWADPNLFDFRVWPRAAVVAERLWSPREVRDVPDMYRRLARVDELLVETGVQHRAWPRFEGFAPDEAAALRALAELVEPVKRYRRFQFQRGDLDTPLNELPDWARSESRVGREFGAEIERWLAAEPKARAASAETLLTTLAAWRAVGLAAADVRAETAVAQGRAETARRLVGLCEAAATAVRALAAGRPLAEAERAVTKESVERAGQPTGAAVEFPFLPAVRRLVGAAEQVPAATP